MKLARTKTVTAVILAALCGAVAAAKPNVIFVLADDLGIGDVTATGPACKIRTPHIQRMADEGMTDVPVKFLPDGGTGEGRF